MKKSVFALVMALVLLCSSAMASEAAFSYTAEEYIAGFTQLYMQSQKREVVWSDPIDTADVLTGVVGSAEGMSDVYVYTVRGDTACCGIGTGVTVSLNGSTQEAYEMSKTLGTASAAITFSSRYVELDYDLQAIRGDLQAIQDACTTLVQNVFSSDAIYTAIADGSYSETAEIAGHTAQMKLVVDMDSSMATVTFVFMP